MKKSNLIIAILLVISIVILILSFSKNNKDIVLIKVDYVNNIKFDNDEQLIAIAYLNNIEEASSKYVTNFDNIKVYQTSGSEKYLIIPRNDVEINIYDSVVDNNILVKDKLIATTNLPFVITCNNSEILSNTILEIKYNDKVLEYSPSLKDGNINTNKYILDITK